MRHLTSILLGLLFPLSLLAQGWESDYANIERSIRKVQFPDKSFVITKYGASPTATAAKNQAAINKAIDACSKAGGGKVVVPAGTWNTGALRLRSHVNLVVEKDARLLFAFDTTLYPTVLTRWEGIDVYNYSPCIYAYGETDVAITGEGVIDGNGSRETWWPMCGAARYGWTESTPEHQRETRPQLLRMAEDGKDVEERQFGPGKGLRPQLINLYKCDGILLEDLTLVNSPFWVVHPLMSTDITVRGLKIWNEGPNGDGCDPESCDRVLIENCLFHTGDDCIAIKSGRNVDGRKWNIPSQNIIVRNCEMQDGHGGVVIGSEISGGCRNVYVENCKMDSPNLDRVLRIKTNSCRGGVIENIFMRKVEVGECREAVMRINLNYEPKENCCRGFNPTVRNVYMEDVTCKKSKYGLLLNGLEDADNIYNINVKNCRFDGVQDTGLRRTGLSHDLHLDNVFANGSLLLTENPYKHYSEWLTYSEMKRVPQSYLLDFSTKPKWSYVMGIELESMLDTYLEYGGQDIMDYCKAYTDTMIDSKGVIRGYDILDYNLDNIRTGHFVTRMYQLAPEKKNLVAMQTMLKQLDKQPRTVVDKVYWHKAIYAYQVWLDGIFMGLPYRALTASTLMKPAKARKIFDDAVNQVSITYDRTLDPVTGLNRHAYDENRNMFWADKSTGLSQHCWGRAQGWYTMALIELLDAVPEDYPRRGELIELLKKDLDAIIKWQDKDTGVWYQVMDALGREGNYLESTCSSMFAYALLKAYRKGYLGEKYRDAGVKAYNGILKQFIRVNADKTISLTSCCSVAGLGPGISPQVEAALKRINPKAKAKENVKRDGSYEYYLSEPIRDNDAKGVGPFIWASLEMERLMLK